jgi:hypothetical protein
MAKRYSGNAHIDVQWHDDVKTAIQHHFSHGGYYQATISVDRRNVWSGKIGAPAFLARAVDSPEAYDDTASAALSFALDEGVEAGGTPNEAMTGWDIRRTKRRAR